MTLLDYFVRIPEGFRAAMGSQGALNFERLASPLQLWIRDANTDRELHLHAYTFNPTIPDYVVSHGSPYGPVMVFTPGEEVVLEYCSPRRPDYLGSARSLLLLQSRPTIARMPSGETV